MCATHRLVLTRQLNRYPDNLKFQRELKKKGGGGEGRGGVWKVKEEKEGSWIPKMVRNRKNKKILQ